ncbi:MAG: hypothetical protein H6812_01980 [Phycisphaeraceae bacterium]|nr:hypothetical protein [Phycisphaerales bacterium]MCB9842006.1 hypothetical protein [Phycisphaeraceae bacterium]
MSMCVRLSHALLALVISVVPASLAVAENTPPAPPAPPPGVVIAHECAQQMQEVTQQTVGAIVMAAHNGADRIGQLDEGGAPDLALIAAAGNARDRVNDRAQAGRQRVNHLSAHCLHALEHLDVPPPIRMIVINARDHALDVIGTARQNGIVAINAALAEALSGDKG